MSVSFGDITDNCIIFKTIGQLFSGIIMLSKNCYFACAPKEELKLIELFDKIKEEIRSKNLLHVLNILNKYVPNIFIEREGLFLDVIDFKNCTIKFYI